MIKIDGSYKEGGGQILRTATLFSCVTGKPCHIFNIRKNRPKPGLAIQHLLGLEALARLCNAKLEGANLRSQEIWFEPSKISAYGGPPPTEDQPKAGTVGGQTKDLKVEIPTAGSITLVLQTLIIPASFAKEPIKIHFRGGATDTHFAPTINYLQYVLLPIIHKLGYKIKIDIKRRGYYPKGGAEVEVIVYPVEPIKPIKLIKSGKLIKISILSYASKYLEKAKVAERQAETAEKILNKFSVRIERDVKYFDTPCPGSSIDIIAEYENTVLGANALGKIGKRAEVVGEEAAKILLEDLSTKTCLDRYIADQILSYIALSKGTSQFSVAQVTNHCLTTIWVIEKFTKGKFKVKNNIIKWISS